MFSSNVAIGHARHIITQHYVAYLGQDQCARGLGLARLNALGLTDLIRHFL